MQIRAGRARPLAAAALTAALLLLAIASGGALAAAGGAPAWEPSLDDEVGSPMSVGYTGQAGGPQPAYDEVEIGDVVAPPAAPAWQGIDSGAPTPPEPDLEVNGTARSSGFKTYIGRVLSAAASRRRCQYPLNQIFWTQNTTSRTVQDFWFGTWSYNGYAFRDGPAGGNVPGNGGASCSDPPKWGPAFDPEPVCSGTPPPFRVGTFQWTLPNAFAKNANHTVLSMITGFKVYYDDTGAITRHEISGGLWSPESPAEGSRGRGWVRDWSVGYGVSPKCFGRMKRARAVEYKAPPGMVLGSVFGGKCGKVKGSNVLRRLTWACAIPPSGYPQHMMFKDQLLARRYGYTCNQK